MAHSEIYAQIDRSAQINGLAKSSPITKTFFALSTLFISVFSQSPIVPILIFIINTALILIVAKVKAHFYLNLLIYPTFMVVVSCLILALFWGNVEPYAQFTTS